jgi:Tol biopolymer transport system component
MLSALCVSVLSAATPNAAGGSSLRTTAAECKDCGVALRQFAALSPELSTPADAASAKYLSLDSRLDPVLFGAPGCNGPVHAIALNGRRAFLGGSFSICGDQPASNIVAFDIDSGLYAGLADGVDGAVDVLHLDGERLYVAGRFLQAGGSAAAGVALWDGLDWQALAQAAATVDEVGPVELRALTVYAGVLHLAGRFDRIDGIPARNIARLGTAGWEPLGPGLDDRVNALAVHDNQLVAGGRFQHAGEVASPLAAFWDGELWLAQPASFLGGPQTNASCSVPREIRGLLSLDDQLVAAGLLRPLGASHVDTAAAIYRDGTWDAVQLRQGTAGGCNSGFSYSKGFDGLLLVDGEPWAFGQFGFGGDFHFVSSIDGERSLNTAPTLAAANAADAVLLAGPPGRNGPLLELARDDEGTLRLTPLARARVSGSVRAVLEDADGVLVGGDFSQVAGIIAANIARWDGSDWAPLGGIEGNGVNGPIYAMARYQGSLYVGGEFSEAGGIPAANIARWDGSNWHPLDEGIASNLVYFPTRVLALAEFDGELVVAGHFSFQSGTTLSSIALWNGNRWQPLQIDGEAVRLRFWGNCFTPFTCALEDASVAVHGLLAFDGSLYISGFFNRVEGITGFSHNGSGVLRWDGDSLSSHGPSSWNPDPSFAADSVQQGRFSHAVAPVVLDGQLHFAFDPFVPYPDGSVPAHSRTNAAIGSWDPESGDSYSEFLPGDLDLHRIEGLAVHDGRIHAAGKLRTDLTRRTSAIGRLEGNRLHALPAQGVFAHGTAPAVLASVAGALYAADLAFGRFPLVDSVFVSGTSASGPRLSRDGRSWVFEASLAQRRIFRRHIDGRNEDLSALVLTAGLADPATDFAAPSLSADGLTAAFEGSDGQVYLVRANRVQRASSSADGAPGNGISRAASVAPSGELLAFASTAGNLGAPADGRSRIHVLNVIDGSIEVLELPGSDPAIADDGTVAWISDGQVIVSRLTENGREQRIISYGSGVAVGDGPSSAVRLSADGRNVVYVSEASNLVAGDDNGVADVFQLELDVDGRPAGPIRRVSVDSFGRGGNAASQAPSISDNGQWVAFHSAADNLVEADSNGAADVFVHFLHSGETRLVNARYDIVPEASGTSQDAWLSGDGSTIVFSTTDPSFGAQQGDPVIARSQFSQANRDDGHSPRRWPESGRLPLPIDDVSGCPGGYHIATVEDGPLAGVQPGSWGLELLLQERGRRVLAGGLNFGSLISTAQRGFAAFNIANAAAEPQRLQLALTGHGRSRDESLPLLLEVQRQVDGVRETLYRRELVIDMTQAFEHELVLQPGFHVIVLQSRAPTAGDDGGAVGRFFLSATTEFTNRAGGGFQGGAVIGGHHDELLGGVSGFAGICLPKAGDISARVIGLEAPAAADLRLRLLDAQLRETVVLE